MRLFFATEAALKRGPSAITSDWASARYRVLLPARELRQLGHDVHVASLADHAGRWPDELPGGAFDAAVISKSFSAQNERLASALKQRKVRLLVDVCDDHFEDATHGPHLRAMIALADGVVAASDVMADAIRRHTGRESLVISDPVEGPRGTPRFAPSAEWLRVAWFGMPSNLVGLSARKAQLRSLFERVPVHLTVVTAAVPDVLPFIERLGAAVPSRLRVELVPWSLDATWNALAQADLAWIPSDGSAQAAAKSPNRLLEVLWAGRLAIADAIGSYVPFSDLTPVGEDLARAALAALQDPAAVEGRIAHAQRRIEASHSPAACAAQWARALEVAATSTTRTVR